MVSYLTTFARKFHVGHGSEIIDMVFDVYRYQSIKSAERSEESVYFNEIKPSEKIKKRWRLLAHTESKNKLTLFIADSSKELNRREKLGVCYAW